MVHVTASKSSRAKPASSKLKVKACRNVHCVLLAPHGRALVALVLSLSHCRVSCPLLREGRWLPVSHNAGKSAVGPFRLSHSARQHICVLLSPSLGRRGLRVLYLMALARNLPAGLYRSSKGVAGPGGVARGPRGRGGGATDRQARPVAGLDGVPSHCVTLGQTPP